MRTEWSVVPASGGDGTWLVSQDDETLCVFAAPGVALPTASRRPCDATRHGWRRSVWSIADDPVIDFDMPIETTAVATSDVCQVLPHELRNVVRNQMVNQLTIALSFGEIGWSGLVDDDAAHARQACATWIVSELREAFPEEAWELPRPSLLVTVIPDTYDDFLERLPHPRARAVNLPEDPTAALGARDLLRLLSIVLLRRMVAVLDRVGAVTHPHLHRSAERDLDPPPDRSALVGAGSGTSVPT